MMCLGEYTRPLGSLGGDGDTICLKNPGTFTCRTNYSFNGKKKPIKTKTF